MVTPDEHQLILKDYSPTFCKMKFIDLNDKNITKNLPDKICYREPNVIFEKEIILNP